MLQSVKRFAYYEAYKILLAAHASESGVGRWIIIKIPTLSFYEYCEMVGLNDRPELSRALKPIQLFNLPPERLEDLMRSLSVLQKYFHRYLMVGGFPEIAISDDVPFAQRILREDVVDKVLKRDLTALFGVRNVAELEKVYRQASNKEKEIDVVVDYHPVGRLLIEVKYRENIGVGRKEAIVELADDPDTAAAIVITKRSEDYGVLDYETKVPIIKITAFAFLYMLGHAEKQGYLTSISQ